MPRRRCSKSGARRTAQQDAALRAARWALRGCAPVIEERHDRAFPRFCDECAAEVAPDHIRHGVDMHAEPVRDSAVRLAARVQAQDLKVGRFHVSIVPKTHNNTQIGRRVFALGGGAFTGE